MTTADIHTLAEDIAQRCAKARATGHGWQACCPAHDDQHPSLSITPKDNKVLLYCHAGCTFDAIVAALDMQVEDFFLSHTPGGTNGHKRIVKVYDYHDAHGTLVHQTVRYDPKGFAQRRPDPASPGAYIWNLQGIEPVLYHLPHVLEAIQRGETILLPEGEKDCDTLHALGFVATCNPMGAEKWRDSYTETLRGAHVALLADHDAMGRKHVALVRQKLSGIVATLKVVSHLHTQDEGSDISDWLKAGGTREALEAAIEATPLWAPSSTDATADAQQEQHGHADVPWPPLQALPSLLPDVPSLPAAMLPEALRPWIEDIAERMQVPLEYVAIPALIALGAVVGRQVGIHPKRHDDWLVVANLWGAIVGRSGLMKSPTLAQALRPLDRLAAGAIEASEAREERNKVIRDALDAQIAGVKEALKKAAKDATRTGVQTHTERLATLQAERDELTTRVRRFKTNDATIQKLGELLRDNPHGLLFFRDELAGWLSSLSQEGREGDREFFLETWNGDGTYTFDRIGRGMVHVKGLCLSIVGGIQPGKLAKYVYEACEGGVGDDGLLQRFQLLVWPAADNPFVNVDRYPHKQERDRAYKIYERLLDLDPATLEATIDEYQEIPALRFSFEAQEFFDAWRLDLESRLRSGTLNSPAFESHLAKYRSLMPSLALLFHLVRKMEGWEGTTVPLDIAKQAAAWCEFLEMHAKKVYAGVLNRDLQAAHALAAKITEGAIADGQAPRELIRAQWSLLRESEDVYGGLRRLETAGWIRLAEKPATSAKGGRPTTLIRLHPELLVRQGRTHA